MAPRRGGSSGSSGLGDSSGESSCPGAFQSAYSTEIVYFVAYCLFWLVTLLILIALWRVKKRHPNAQKLVGPVYLASLLLSLLAYTLLIIAIVLLECGTTPSRTYYHWAITFTVFFRLATFLLLVVFASVMNTVLRERLGYGSKIFNIAQGVVLGFMAIVMGAYVGLQCYNLSFNFRSSGRSSRSPLLNYEQERLALAYWMLYLLSVLASGAFAIVTLVSMRSKRIPTGHLIGWVTAVTLSMFIWVLLTVIQAGAAVDPRSAGLGRQTYFAFEYIVDAFQTLSWIFLLCLAKSKALFGSPMDTTNHPVQYNSTYLQPQQPYIAPPPLQQQYAYDGDATQQYYYQQQPAYNGTTPLAHHDRHELK
ncbi:hypothetical protein BDV95DRAFT_230963 [Massariosphaeria phaeospora]|uniref:Uncharacterized protein n=1 Tax=Massariosphaeria phaeospora TaxID=100035 RepID=A0A7C8MTK7_9PLEO|nr:hypothetical protein BDV95DRAFT_230963 [Massariosphaeria phaeospora]